MAKRTEPGMMRSASVGNRSMRSTPLVACLLRASSDCAALKLALTTKLSSIGAAASASTYSYPANMVRHSGVTFC